MKNLIVVLVMLPLFGMSQQTYFHNLNVNNLNLRITPTSSFFRTDSVPEMQLDSGSLFYSSAIWITGVDQNAEIKFAGDMYGSNGSDFQTGPVMDTLLYASEAASWNRLWVLSRSDIEYHKANYNTSGYTPSPTINSWPGNGNTSKGQASRLAPFADLNSNNIYEPTSGDYPIIKGDKAVYYILNDDKQHEFSDGKKIRAEFHYMFYAYSCNSNQALENSVFLDLRVINRGQDTINGTQIGIWTDGDLGFSNDDYVGCDVKNSSYYFYNGDKEDGPGQNVFGALPPAAGIVFLKGARIDSDGLDNDSLSQYSMYTNNGYGFKDNIIDNESSGMHYFLYHNIGGGPTGDPWGDTDFYRTQNARWRDDSGMQYGGNGYQTGGVQCKYMFPADSDPIGFGTNGVPQPAWSEVTAGNSPNDRRGIGSTGPFIFYPGTENTVTVAYTYAHQTTDSLDSVNVNEFKKQSALLHSWYRAGQISCTSVTGINQSTESVISVFPNPAKNSLYVKLPVNRTETMMIYNFLGEKVLEQKVSASSSIYLDPLPSGTYFYKIAGHTGKFQKIN